MMNHHLTTALAQAHVDDLRRAATASRSRPMLSTAHSTRRRRNPMSAVAALIRPLRART